METSSQESPKCLHHNCPLPAAFESGYCICHAQVEKKDAYEELASLKRLLEETGDFSEVYVTVPFSLQDLEIPGFLDFSGAIFLEFFSISHCSLVGGASFTGAKFHKGLSVADSVFLGGTDFSSITVSEIADFRRARWVRPSNSLAEAQANKMIPSQQVVSGEASFYGARFLCDVRFDHSEFAGELVGISLVVAEGHSFDMSGAILQDNLRLNNAHFGGNVNLGKARFWAGVWFYHVKIDGYFFARDVSFGGLATFTGKKDNLLFSRAGGTFQSSLFYRPDHSYFEFCDLSRVELRQVNLRGVGFDRVKWCKVYGRRGVFDEKILRSGSESSLGDPPTFDQIRFLYAQLKSHWTSQGQAELAGEFHYGEREMARLGSDQLDERGINFLYWVLSGYGEKPMRALCWVVFIWAFFGLIYGILRDHEIGPMLYSFQVMTLQNRDSVHLIESIQRLVGPIQTGFFALAMRRKLVR